MDRTHRCSSVHNIVEEFSRKRCRKKLDMLMNEEDEQEEGYLQARQVKRRFLPLTLLMKKLNLPRGVQGEREQDTAAVQKYTTKRKLTNVQQDEEIKRQKTKEHIGKKFKACGPMDVVASLPTDIVFLILDKMLEAIDHARFAVVCKDWQSLAEEYNRERRPWFKVHPPMLWIPTQSHGSKASNDTTAQLYSLSEGKLYSNIKLPVHGNNRIYCGHGWMAKLEYQNQFSDDASLAITLMNPFRKTKDILLPQIRRDLFRVKQVVKIILSADPTLDPNNYVVIAICGCRLYYIKGEQKLWTWMPIRDACCAATYYEGRVFSVHWVQRLKMHHIYDSSTLLLEVLLENRGASRVVQTYFVKSTKGDLLIVERLLGPKETDGPMMLSFKVSKFVLNLDGSVAQLAEVNNIGDGAVFVDNNQSVCVLASKLPGCQPNSIYYTNDVKEEQGRHGSEDIGMFNLEDGSHGTITPHYPHKSMKGHMVPAIWITPPFPIC